MVSRVCPVAVPGTEGSPGGQARLAHMGQHMRCAPQSQLEPSCCGMSECMCSCWWLQSANGCVRGVSAKEAVPPLEARLPQCAYPLHRHDAWMQCIHDLASNGSRSGLACKPEEVRGCSVSAMLRSSWAVRAAVSDTVSATMQCARPRVHPHLLPFCTDLLHFFE
jgi:hypothetical protein